MTTVFIQIPCFNEAEALPVALAALPKTIEGVDRLEVLVIDDGSTDETIEAAKKNGVKHIVSLPYNKGLANAFKAGLDYCLAHGADIIVNTDADNQYCADDIPALVKPVLEKKSDIVVGARPIDDIAHFSFIKKKLQRLGSWVVRMASNTDIPDAPSGFRALSREAALQLNVFNDYTYTLETIIQAGQKNIPISWVPVRVNPDMRPSRLVKSIPRYVMRSVMLIVRIFMVYRPLAFFFLLGLVPFTIGFLLGIRWLVLFALHGGIRTHVPSLILAAICLIMGFQTFTIGLVSNLIGTNRALLEEQRLERRRKKFAKTCKDKK